MKEALSVDQLLDTARDIYMKLVEMHGSLLLTSHAYKPEDGEWKALVEQLHRCDWASELTRGTIGTILQLDEQ